MEGELVPYLTLGSPMIFLFALVTVLIAAGGYLINDYFDFESDLINEKKHRLDSKTAYLLYYALIVFAGFSLSLYIAMSIGKVLLATIYLIAVAAMYLYSAIWKKKVLIGNIVVALFSAFVVAILIYAEKAYLFGGEGESTTILSEMVVYCVFAFLISMVREIVKDMEDIKGDEMAGYNTLPLVHGMSLSRYAAIGFGLLLLSTLIYWVSVYDFVFPPLILIYFVGFLVLPLMYVLFCLMNEKYFKPWLVSRICKSMMIFGIFFLLLTVNFI